MIPGLKIEDSSQYADRSSNTCQDNATGYPRWSKFRVKELRDDNFDWASFNHKLPIR